MVQVVRWGCPGRLLSLLLVCFCLATPVSAFDLGFNIGSGYDDNPRLEKGSEGALFTQTELDLGWTLPLESIPAASISLFAFADYQLYSGLDNNWQLGGGLVSTTQVTTLPGTFNLFSEVAIYRNPLVNDNDFDALNIGSSFVWFADPQLSLEFETSLNWEDYCDTVINGNHRPNTNNNHNSKTQKPEKPQHHNSGDRSDRLFTTSLKSLYAFSPGIDGTSEIFWRHRHSSIDAECRSAYGLNLNFSWRPIPTVEFNWGLGGERIPYKYKYKKQTRTEKIYNLTTEISWYLQDFTFSAAWDWNDHNSTVKEDDYHRNRWQIRLKYSY